MQVQALCDLADRGIVHRNVCPDSILVDCSGHLLLSNFESAVSVNTVTGPPLTTPFIYLPPECSGRPISQAYVPSMDTWSVGRVILQLYYHEQTPTERYAELLRAVAFNNPLLYDLLSKVSLVGQAYCYQIILC